jgi:hypothetical protein
MTNPMGRKKSEEELDLEAQFAEVDRKDEEESSEEGGEMNVEDEAGLLSNSDEESDGEEGEGPSEDADEGSEEGEEEDDEEIEEKREAQPKVGEKRKLRFFEVKDNEINPLKRCFCFTVNINFSM